MINMKKDWRQFHKGDLVYVWGMAKGGFGFMPAFVYESQRQKNIVQIYAFGEFDEWSSSYVDKTYKAKGPREWLEDCERAGYKREYVLKKMKEFNVEPLTEIKA
jgi:hypothetical protein